MGLGLAPPSHLSFELEYLNQQSSDATRCNFWQLISISYEVISFWLELRD